MKETYKATSSGQLILLLISLICLSTCRSNVSEQQSKNLLDQANKLLEQQTQVDSVWSREYGQVFSPEQRAKFPSNRDFLRSRAERLIMLLDESSRLGKAAVEKYEQATGLESDDKKKRAMVLFGSAIKKDLETNQAFKEFAQLASDTTIQDVNTLNERFTHLDRLISQKKKEKDRLVAEGKRLLGM